jgi:hypothetical protein
MFFNAVKKGSGKHAAKGLLKSIYLTPKKITQRRQIQKKTTVSTSYIQSILWHDLPPDQTGLRKLRSFFSYKR